MMKKVLTIIALICITITIVSAVPVSAKSVVKYSTFKKDYYEGNTKILSVTIKTPKLTSKTKAAKKINKYFVNLKKRYIKEALSYSRNEYYNSNWIHEGLFTSKATLTYNKRGVYSFKESYSHVFANCAGNGAQEIKSYTFKKSTGKKISNSAVIKKAGYTSKAFKKAVKTKVKKIINNSSSNNYYKLEEALSHINSLPLSKYGLFFKGKKLYIGIPPYTISPWIPSQISIKNKHA